MEKDLKYLMGEAFDAFDEDRLLEILNKSINSGLDAVDIVHCLSENIQNIGRRFSEGELFLPDLIMAGDLMETCMGKLEPYLTKGQTDLENIGKVIIGSVKGDVHDIGKNMVKMMLSVSGFDVVDLGTDVGSEKFLENAISEKPDIIAMSSCMTTTVPSMEDTIDLLKSRNMDKICNIVVGGGSVNNRRAESFGNCTYGGKDAFESVLIMKRLCQG